MIFEETSGQHEFKIKEKPRQIMKRYLLITSLLCFFIVIASTFQMSAQTDQKRDLPQFVFEKFTKGIVKMKAGNKYVANINYNMVDEEMIFEQKGNYLALENIKDIDTVYIQNRSFVPVGEAFYEVIAAGKATFFIQHKSRYSKEGTPTAYGITSPTNSSVKVTSVKGANSFRSLEVPENTTVNAASVNWVNMNGTMEKINGEKAFLKVFPEKETELKAFIKTNKISFKSREDLIKLGNYCNGLLK
jgi:hypothetical protein